MDTLVNTNINEQAAEKLKTEMDKSEKQPFAHPILAYLIDRCIEDSGLAEDVMQEHKTWNKCFSYICDQAKKMKRTGNCVAVEDQTVFEWAEDYYHQDDKAIEEEKKRKAAEQKKKAEEQKKKAAEKAKKEPKKAEKKTKEKPEPSKGQQALKQIEKVNKDIKEEAPAKSTQMEGQMDIFSWLKEAQG